VLLHTRTPATTLLTTQILQEMARLSVEEVFKKTIYAEARGEPLEGQEWVGWVIKNRAWIDKDYWGGSSIKNVCLHPGQFECWNGRSDITITEQLAYEGISRWAPGLLAAPRNEDPTGGADHYNNPAIECSPPPSWIDQCDRLRMIGKHQFYKTRPQYL